MVKASASSWSSCSARKCASNSANVASDYARAEKLYAAGSMPKATYDRAKYQAQNANLQISAFATSPRPSMRPWFPRSTAARASGPAPGVNLLTIEDLAHPYAYIYMPLEERAKLKLGSKVKGYLAGDDSKAYEGTVTFLRPEAEFTPKNVQTRDERERLVFGVKIAFENPDNTLSPGLPIDVKTQD